MLQSGIVECVMGCRQLWMALLVPDVSLLFFTLCKKKNENEPFFIQGKNSNGLFTSDVAHLFT